MRNDWSSQYFADLTLGLVLLANQDNLCYILLKFETRLIIHLGTSPLETPMVAFRDSRKFVHLPFLPFNDICSSN